MTDNSDAIREALLMMDATEDDQWTSNGLPKVEVLSEATGIENLTRKDITDAAPLFNRENPQLEVAAENTDAANAVDTETPTTDPTDASSDDEADVVGDDETEADTNSDTDRVEVSSYAEAHGKEEIVEAQKRLAEAEAAKTKADEEWQAAGNELTRLMNKYVLKKTPQQNQDTIRAYINSQTKQRHQAAKDKAALAEALGLPNVSAIDAVAARKLGHGRDRKAHPLKVVEGDNSNET